MKRNILFWTYFIIAVVLAVYFASRFVTSYLGYGPVSKVHAIVVTPSDIIDTENIQKQLYIKNNSIRYAFNNLEFFNKNIRDNYPNVKNTAIRIMPNGDININLEMYTPVAIWTKDNVNYYPITADGKKINTPTTTPETNSLVFKGILPNDLSKIISSVTGIIEYIDYLEWIENRRWNIHTKFGTTILLPAIGFDEAISKINKLNKSGKLLSRKITVLDLRDEKRILVIPNK